MLQPLVSLVLLRLVLGSDCPDHSLCEGLQTCCEIPSGDYTCCPFQQAECCVDHLHCCPEGMLCMLATAECSNATHTLPWTDRGPGRDTHLPTSFPMITSSPSQRDGITCPDDSRCRAELWCLKLPEGYGCCPVEGVVCADGKHCCPEDHLCNADSSSCVPQKAGLMTPVRCGDGVFECPEGTSCCETDDQSWGCCPMPRAVCCDDRQWCCDEGSRCDVLNRKCVSVSGQERPMWSKFPARRRADWEEHKSAVTPADAELVNTAPPEAPEADVAKNVPCNDTVGCQDGSTCCKDKEGEWDCCPLPAAVCCDDFIHCCPHDTVCNLPAKTCDDPSDPLTSMPWLDKLPSVPIRRGQGSVGNVTCDPTHYCLDGSTCCITTTGDWACCPMPEAVCCDDHVHCCPHGSTCNLAALECEQCNVSVPMLEKTPAQTRPPPVTPSPPPTTPSPPPTTPSPPPVTPSPPPTTPSPPPVTPSPPPTTPSPPPVTPSPPPTTPSPPPVTPSPTQCAAHTTCPEHSTCCIMGNQQKWGCCPLRQAVCCVDQQHCCPEGYVCDVASGSCIKSILLQVEMVPMTMIHSPAQHQNDIPCGEGYSCHDDQTCCKTSDTIWGCCPSPKAVCCSDMKHCCPAGYTCGEGTCEQPLGLSWSGWGGDWGGAYTQRGPARLV